MKLNKFLLGGCLAGTLFLGGCSAEDLAEYNTNPTVISKPDMRFLFTQGLAKFLPSDYWDWWYDFTAMSQYGQVTGGSNTIKLNIPDLSSGNGSVASTLKILREMDYQLSLMSEEEAAKYAQIRAALQSLVVYMGIQDTDFYGSAPYSEAYSARYGGTLTPKYDTQEELFTQFYEELKEATDILVNGKSINGTAISQTSLGNQDFVYKGDVSKWAKFANSLKLKLAVRLMHVDKTWAKQIVTEAASHAAGFMTDISDNFIYNQGTSWYYSKEDPAPGTGNVNLIQFMVDNKDPRVRFFFMKNDFNSEVVQAYIDAKKDLPSYIADKVITKEVEEEVDGEIVKRTVFDKWAAPGEPWVRYVGLPIQLNASADSKWEQYYDPKNQWLKLEDKTYSATSYLNLEMYEGNRTYTYPTKPGGTVVQDKDPKPFYGLYMSAGEVNLYLAELCQLGMMSGSASDYFEAGVRASVQEWNDIATLNQIPYAVNKYDKNEELITLKEGEIDELVKQPAYKLTGAADDLEKIYLQMHFAFILDPWEMYVTMRRSGVPMRGSAYLPYEEFPLDGGAYSIPRRATFTEPAKSDQMYDIIIKSYEEQGFSVGNNASKLESERVWYDKGAPAWGAGPNYK